MSTRGICLERAVAAAMLSLHAAEVTAGQNQERWMVFDRDSASRLVGALPDSALTPEQVRDFRLLGPSDDRAVARYFPELEAGSRNRASPAGRQLDWTVGGFTVIVLTLFDDLTASRRVRLRVALNADAYPKVDEMLSRFAVGQQVE